MGLCCFLAFVGLLVSGSFALRGGAGVRDLILYCCYRF